MKNTAAHPIGVEWAVPKASKVAMRESKARAAIAKATGRADSVDGSQKVTP